MEDTCPLHPILYFVNCLNVEAQVFPGFIRQCGALWMVVGPGEGFEAGNWLLYDRDPHVFPAKSPGGNSKALDSGVVATSLFHWGESTFGLAITLTEDGYLRGPGESCSSGGINRFLKFFSFCLHFSFHVVYQIQIHL